jgi:hypothetical protein
MGKENKKENEPSLIPQFSQLALFSKTFFSSFWIYYVRTFSLYMFVIPSNFQEREEKERERKSWGEKSLIFLVSETCTPVKRIS